MRSPHGELIGVISVDRPKDGRRPGAQACEALRTYAFHSAISISMARRRANMQRTLVRLEREQTALRASEESFRQTFEYAPNGVAIAELGGDSHGRLLRVNSVPALWRRPASRVGRPAAPPPTRCWGTQENYSTAGSSSPDRPRRDAWAFVTACRY
ncbi:hypothetical protein GCM10017562_58990 [Streptomyces roseofulvus]